LRVVKVVDSRQEAPHPLRASAPSPLGESRKLISLAKWPKAELLMAALHYIQENKATYNLWENFAKTHLIDFKRVNSLRQAASAGSLHYVTETKRVIGFMGRHRKTGYN
jgi:hypothetical protein